jgi:hypothetical protein
LRAPDGLEVLEPLTSPEAFEDVRFFIQSLCGISIVID